MKIIGFIIILLIVIFGVTFAILNAEPVTVYYYIGIKQLPLSLLIAITFGVGLILGLSLMSLMILRMKAEKYRLKKRLKVIEKEVENLRTIPIKE
jgi:putative membrane protein